MATVYPIGIVEEEATPSLSDHTVLIDDEQVRFAVFDAADSSGSSVSFTNPVIGPGGELAFVSANGSLVWAHVLDATESAYRHFRATAEVIEGESKRSTLYEKAMEIGRIGDGCTVLSLPAFSLLAATETASNWATTIKLNHAAHSNAHTSRTVESYLPETEKQDRSVTVARWIRWVEPAGQGKLEDCRGDLALFPLLKPDDTAKILEVAGQHFFRVKNPNFVYATFGETVPQPTWWSPASSTLDNRRLWESVKPSDRDRWKPDEVLGRDLCELDEYGDVCKAQRMLLDRIYSPGDHTPSAPRKALLKQCRAAFSDEICEAPNDQWVSVGAIHRIGFKGQLAGKEEPRLLAKLDDQNRLSLTIEGLSRRETSYDAELHLPGGGILPLPIAGIDRNPGYPKNRWLGLVFLALLLLFGSYVYGRRFLPNRRLPPEGAPPGPPVHTTEASREEVSEPTSGNPASVEDSSQVTGIPRDKEANALTLSAEDRGGEAQQTELWNDGVRTVGPVGHAAMAEEGAQVAGAEDQILSNPSVLETNEDSSREEAAERAGKAVSPDQALGPGSSADAELVDDGPGPEPQSAGSVGRRIGGSAIRLGEECSTSKKGGTSRQRRSQGQAGHEDSSRLRGAASRKTSLERLSNNAKDLWRRRNRLVPERLFFGRRRSEDEIADRIWAKIQEKQARLIEQTRKESESDLSKARSTILDTLRRAEETSRKEQVRIKSKLSSEVQTALKARLEEDVPREVKREIEARRNEAKSEFGRQILEELKPYVEHKRELMAFLENREALKLLKLFNENQALLAGLQELARDFPTEALHAHLTHQPRPGDRTRREARVEAAKGFRDLANEIRRLDPGHQERIRRGVRAASLLGYWIFALQDTIDHLPQLAANSPPLGEQAMAELGEAQEAASEFAERISPILRLLADFLEAESDNQQRRVEARVGPRDGVFLEDFGLLNREWDIDQRFRVFFETPNPVGRLGQLCNALQYQTEALPAEYLVPGDRQTFEQFLRSRLALRVLVAETRSFHRLIKAAAAAAGLDYRPLYYYESRSDDPENSFIEQSLRGKRHYPVAQQAEPDSSLIIRLERPFFFMLDTGTYYTGEAVVRVPEHR